MLGTLAAQRLGSARLVGDGRTEKFYEYTVRESITILYKNSIRYRDSITMTMTLTPPWIRWLVDIGPPKQAVKSTLGTHCSFIFRSYFTGLFNPVFFHGLLGSKIGKGCFQSPHPNATFFTQEIA